MSFPILHVGYSARIPCVVGYSLTNHVIPCFGFVEFQVQVAGFLPQTSGLSLKYQSLGKTVLFSSIVDQIKDTIPDSQVIFFYCKNRDPLKNTFDGVARSLITQLLRLNPVSLGYLHETAVNSGERHPSTFKTYGSILEHMTSTHDSLFIGIDGLDECEKEDRCLILSLLAHVLKVSSPQAKIKIFLTSQRMNDLENSLKSAIRFEIKNHHVKQDIEYFVHKRALQLCDKFSLSLGKKNSITARISNRSEGNRVLFECDYLSNLIRHVFTCTTNHG